jgi:hypothetical protein
MPRTTRSVADLISPLRQLDAYVSGHGASALEALEMQRQTEPPAAVICRAID